MSCKHKEIDHRTAKCLDCGASAYDRLDKRVRELLPIIRVRADIQGHTRLQGNGDSLSQARHRLREKRRVKRTMALIRFKHAPCIPFNGFCASGTVVKWKLK